MGNQAQTEHEKKQADDGERQRPEYETDRSEGRVRDAKYMAVSLLLGAMQGNNP